MDAAESKLWTQQTEKKTHSHSHHAAMLTHIQKDREREREGGKDQEGYHSSNNGETLVADAKAEDASRCH